MSGLKSIHFRNMDQQQLLTSCGMPDWLYGINTQYSFYPVEIIIYVEIKMTDTHTCRLHMQNK